MGLFDPQGISSSPSTQSVVTSGVSPWAAPYVFNYLNQGNALLNQSPTPFQQQVWGSAQGLQTPNQFAAGSDLAQQAGQGQLSTTGTALNYGQQGANYGGMGAGIGLQATQAGQNYANQATNGSIGAYMNPYIQQSLAPTLGLLNQQQALGSQDIAAKATGQGAFGGNRATLAQGLNNQGYDLAKQQAIGQGYNTAFQNAQQAQQFGANLGLQGLQAGMQGTAQGIQGAQAGLQGVQGAQQGYSGANQAGVALGNIGAQQGQFQLGALALQNQIANQQYNLPYQRLNFMQGLMSGLPVSSSTTQGYQAGQNPWLQGIGAAGALASYAPALGNAASSAYNWATGGNNYADPSNFGSGWGSYGGGSTPSLISATDLNASPLAKGGEVKRYASGGIASINRKVLNDPTAYSDQTVNQGAQDNILGGVTKLLALDEIAKQKQLMQNQQAMQQPAKPPILAQLQQQAMAQQAPQQAPQQMAQAMPPQGVDSAQSNLPQQYAGGGIIAFDEGGDVPRFNTGGINWWGKSDEGASKDDSPSAFKEDIQNFNNNTKEKIQIPQWIQDIGNYFTKPRQAPTDADAQPGGLYGNGSNTPPVAQAKPDSGIVIHPNAPSRGGPASGPAAPASIPAYKPAETSGIDALTSKFGNMISGGEDFKTAENKAETSGLRNLFFNMMNPEKGASFVSGLGAAGKEAQAGLDKSLEGIQARKDAQIGKLVNLGLKGEDLKNEAKKLGITEAELQAKLPLYGSEVTKNLATADYMRSGKGKSAGKIASATAYKVMQDFNGYKADPKSAPFFNQLPPDVKKGLSLPGTESYNRAMIEFNKILQQEMANQIGMLQAIGGGSSLSSDSLI